MVTESCKTRLDWTRLSPSQHLLAGSQLLACFLAVLKCGVQMGWRMHMRTAPAALLPVAPLADTPALLPVAIGGSLWSGMQTHGYHSPSLAPEGHEATAWVLPLCAGAS